MIAIVQSGCGDTADQAEGTTGVAYATRPTPARVYQIDNTYTTSTYGGQTYTTHTGYKYSYRRELDRYRDGVVDPVTCAELATDLPADTETYTSGLTGLAGTFPGHTSGSATASFEAQCREFGEYLFQVKTWDAAKDYLKQTDVYRSIKANPADPTKCYTPRYSVSQTSTPCSFNRVCVRWSPTYGGGSTCTGWEDQPVYRKTCNIWLDLADKPYVKAPDQDFAGLVQGIAYQMPGGVTKLRSFKRTKGGTAHTVEHSVTKNVSASFGFALGPISLGVSGSDRHGWSTARKQEQMWTAELGYSWPPARETAVPDVPDHNKDRMDIVINADLALYSATCPAGSGISPVTEEFAGLALQPASEAYWADPGDAFDVQHFLVEELVNPCKVTQLYYDACTMDPSCVPDVDNLDINKEDFFYSSRPTGIFKDPTTGDYVCTGGVPRFPPHALKRMWALDPFLDANGKPVLNPCLGAVQDPTNDKFRFVPVKMGFTPCYDPTYDRFCNAFSIDSAMPVAQIGVNAASAVSYMKSHSSGFSWELSGKLDLGMISEGGSGGKTLTWTTSDEDTAMLEYVNEVDVDFTTGMCGSGYVYLDSLSWSLAIPGNVRPCTQPNTNPTCTTVPPPPPLSP